jgi:hypothetical protein
MAYEDRDVINNPSIYAEMVQKSGQSLSPCVEVNGHMLADVSGDEVEAYLLKAGVVQPTARLRRPTGLATRITMRILATSWTKQRKSRSKTPLLRCAKRSRAMTTMPLRMRSMTPGQIPRGQFGALQEGLCAGWSPARPLRRSHRWSRRREEGLRCRRRGVRDGRRR